MDHKQRQNWTVAPKWVGILGQHVPCTGNYEKHVTVTAGKCSLPAYRMASYAAAAQSLTDELKALLEVHRCAGDGVIGEAVFEQGGVARPSLQGEAGVFRGGKASLHKNNSAAYSLYRAHKQFMQG